MRGIAPVQEAATTGRTIHDVAPPQVILGEVPRALVSHLGLASDCEYRSTTNIRSLSGSGWYPAAASLSRSVDCLTASARDGGGSFDKPPRQRRVRPKHGGEIGRA